MSSRCRKFKIEIAAAAGGRLPAKVEEHIAGCSSCAEFQGATQNLASTFRRDEGISQEAAVALARGALAKSEGRVQRAIWIAPLISASASAAALILYCGLFGANTVVTNVAQTEELEATTERYLAPSLPVAEETALPDSLRAVRELLLMPTNADEEEKS